MTFQDETIYRVKLNSVAEIGKFRWRPLNDHSMKGSLVTRIVEKYGEAILDRADPE